MTALALKATLALAAALVVVLAARKTRASVRHMVLAALFAFLLLLPFAERFAPSVPIPADKLPALAQNVGQTLLSAPKNVEQTLLSAQGLEAAKPGQAGSPVPHLSTLMRIYLAGTALLLAWLAIGVIRLRRLGAKSEVWLEGTARMNEIAHHANIRRPALVVISNETTVPMTFGFRMATIVLPEAARTWDAGALGRAIRHELEHIRRDDWALQLLARVACAFYWPHPLVWAAWRRFCFEAERACDDAVVGTFDGAEAYAGQLVTLARTVRRLNPVPALGMAGKSRLAARVAALLDRTQPRGPHGRFATVVAVAVTMLLLVTIAPAKLVAAAKVIDADYSSSDSSPLGEAFIELAEKGDVDEIRQLIDSGVDVNLVVHGDGTALIGAARYGHMELVQFLLANGADVNLPCVGDGNPLIAAAAHGYAPIVELLLDRGASIDEMVQGDENALIKASLHGHEDVVALLIRRGADVNARYVEQGEVRTPLSMARRYGHTWIVELLRKSGARD